MSGFYQGKYKILNPEKYTGAKAPICRSGWEFKFARFLDVNKNVLAWDSEPSQMKIPYNLPDGTSHVYIPDFVVSMRTKDGRVKRFLVEIKPSAQSPYHTKMPAEPKNKTAKALRNHAAKMKMWVTNKFKWEATEKYCKKRGIAFLVYTEIEAKGAFS
jgi:hypothetical protein